MNLWVAMGNTSRGVFKEGLSEEVMFELRLNYEKAPIEPTAPLGTVAQSGAQEDVSVSYKVSKGNELLGRRKYFNISH